MAEFTLPLTAEGAVTAPSGTLDLTVPTAETQTYIDVGEMNVLEISEFGWALADGVNPIRLITRGSVLDAGGLAPSAAPTLAGTGARATVVGTYTAVPTDGQFITIGIPGNSTTITFKSTLVTDGTLGHQVKIATGGTADENADETFANLQALIQGTGTQGTEYFNIWTYLSVEDDFQEFIQVEVSAIAALPTGTITLRYTEFGSVGNTSVSTENLSNFSFASTTFTGGSDGSGTEPSAGTRRYFYTWSRSTDGAETGRSPIATITKSTNENVAISDLADPADTTYDFINVYRTTEDGVEFRLLGTIATLGAGTLNDSISDDTLSRSQLWNQLLYRDYTEGAVPRGRALALWKESIWTLGAHLHAEYSREEVAVTNGSVAISFVLAGTATASPGVTERMVGRTFNVTGTSENYRILSINEASATGVLEREYEGSTDAHVGFTIKDDYDATKLRRCVQFQYNQWPFDESPGSVDTDSPEGGTALLATKSRLFAFSPTSVTGVTGEGPDSWEMSKIAEGVGCPAPGMVVGVEGGGVFLSYDGFYAASPDGSLNTISSPKTPKGQSAQGIEGTVNRIEWANISQGYSTYDPTDRVVVFGVPLDGATSVNYEIIFDLQNGAWALYKRGDWTTCSQFTLPDGSLGLIAGDREGHVWQVGIGESDGFYGTEAVQTLSGAQTTRVLTVSGTPYSTSGDGESGKPVIILYADGSTVAYGKVASNTSSALTLAEDLATAPAASDQVIVGGIAWQVKSGFVTFGEEYRKKTLRSVTIRHAPTTRGEYYFSFAVDNGSLIVAPVGTSIGDLSDTDGKVRHKTQYPGDTHQINLRGFKPGGRAILRGGVFDLVFREHGRM